MKRVQLQITDEEKDKMAADLMNEAKYAANSFNERMVYEVYGKAKMARKFHAITLLAFKELNDLLVVGCINNGEWIREARK